MQQGIVYGLTGESARGNAHTRYHHKPDPLFLNKTKFKSDVSGLKKAQLRQAILESAMEMTSKFTIGMEVEKNQLHRGAVREYEIFCGFEEDGSCGYEAVTHVLPLLPSGVWRTKVYDMMHKAERIIDDRYSPSDRRCGGHITIAVEGLNGVQLNRAIRKNCGIVLSLFKKRLNTKYCGSNRRMQDTSDSVFNSWSGAYEYGRTQCHHKYQTALVKGKCLEFRVPSRFQSVKQMMRRYELFYEIVNFTINKPNGSHDSLLKILKPIILSMYNGDVDKTDEVIALSKHFRKFIMNGEIHQDIATYLV
jgi:hypothetical protein